MRTHPAIGMILATVLALLPLHRLNAESALFGWQAVHHGYSAKAETIALTGPTARNHSPERKGSFRGKFVPRSQGLAQAKLVTIFKLSLDQQGELVRQKIRYTLAPSTNEDKTIGHAVELETEAISFDRGDSFLMIFELGGETEMLVLPILPLFIPS